MIPGSPYRLFGFAGSPMAQLKRMLGGIDREDNNTKMPVINQHTRETRDYLVRGRRFLNLDDNALNRYWIAAYRGLPHRDPKHEFDFDDLSAEFELRKVDLPYELVKHIFEANVAEVKKRLEPETFSSQEIEDMMEELLMLALACYDKTNEDEGSFKEAS